MKKFKLPFILVLTLLVIFSFASCGSDGQTEDTNVEVIYHTVYFSSSGGSAVPSIRVVDGGTAAAPTNPTREGFIFDCWVLDGQEWSFNVNTVTSDITLSAKWIDASSVFSYMPIEGSDGNACITGALRELEELEIPSVINGLNVVAIGEAAFADTSSNKTQKIVVADTVTAIASRAFYNCKDIEIIVKGKPLTVGELAFANCTSLKEITLGNGLTHLSAQAFDGCSSLSDISLPSTIVNIDENAFSDCISLTQITLPSSLQIIGDGAFFGCDELENVYFDGTEAQFDSIVIGNQNNELKAAKINYTES